MSSYAAHVASAHVSKPPTGAQAKGTHAAPSADGASIRPKPKAKRAILTSIPNPPTNTTDTHIPIPIPVSHSAAATTHTAGFGVAGPATPRHTSTTGASTSASPSPFNQPTNHAAVDSYSEQELLGSNHDYIYSHPTSCCHVVIPSVGVVGSVGVPGVLSSPSRFAPSFDGLGRDRCDFKTQLECRVFNLRETMRDEFAKLMRIFKSTTGFAAATNTNLTPSLESSIGRFISESHPVNFFWFALEIFTTSLLDHCWSGVQINAPRGLTTNSQNNGVTLAHAINLHVRLTQPAPTVSQQTNTVANAERRSSGAGFGSPTHAATATRQGSLRRLNGQQSSVGFGLSTPSHRHSSTNHFPSVSSSSFPSDLPASAKFPPHLAFGFSSASATTSSASLASCFPDLEEFFARFILVVVGGENGTSGNATTTGGSAKLLAHITHAIVMKIHQLTDLTHLTPQHAPSSLTSSSSSSSSSVWRFGDIGQPDLQRTWSGRVLKVKLLAKFLSFIKLQEQIDLTRMAVMGGPPIRSQGGEDSGQSGINNTTTPAAAAAMQFEPSTAMMNVALSTSNALNVLSFPPLHAFLSSIRSSSTSSSGSLSLSTLVAPSSFPLPLHLYLSFGVAHHCLALFLPLTCAYLKLFRFDSVIGLRQEYVVRILEELARQHSIAKKRISKEQERKMASAHAPIQRTVSSPSIPMFRPMTTTTTSAGVASSSLHKQHTPTTTTFSGFTPILTPVGTPTLTALHSPSPAFSSRTLGGGVMTPDEQFENELTPPTSPSTRTSPFLFPPGSGSNGAIGMGGGGVGTVGGRSSGGLNLGLGGMLKVSPTSSPAHTSATSSTFNTRTAWFIVFEIEELFEWLELDIAVYADEADRRARREPRIDGLLTGSIATSPESTTLTLPTTPAAKQHPPQPNRLVDPAIATPINSEMGNHGAAATDVASSSLSSDHQPPVRALSRGPRSLLGDLTSSAMPKIPLVHAAHALPPAAIHTTNVSGQAGASVSAQTSQPPTMPPPPPPPANTLTHSPPLRSSSVLISSSTSTNRPFLPLASSTSSPVPSGTIPESRSAFLDSLSNLIPMNLFLALLTSTSNPNRREEIRAVMNGHDPLTWRNRRKESLAPIEGDNNEPTPTHAQANNTINTIPMTLLRRTTSAVTKRKIAPVADSGVTPTTTIPNASSTSSASAASGSGSSSASASASAHSLSLLRIDFFKRHPDLSPLVRFISDTLEKHVRSGQWTGIPTRISEQATRAFKVFEEAHAQQLRTQVTNKDVAGIQTFLDGLNKVEAELVREVQPATLAAVRRDLADYIGSSALKSLESLAAPTVHSAVLQTAAHLATAHAMSTMLATTASPSTPATSTSAPSSSPSSSPLSPSSSSSVPPLTSKSFLETRIHIGIKAYVEKWSKSLRLIWTKRLDGWKEEERKATMAAQQPTAAHTADSTTPINHPLPSSKSPGDSQVSREIATRVSNALRCFDSLLAAAPVGEVDPMLSDSSRVAYVRSSSRRILHVLMPLLICVRASQASPTLSSFTSFEAFGSEAASAPSSVSPSTPSYDGRPFFNRAIQLLQHLQRHIERDDTNTNARTANERIPNEYQQCWMRVMQVYRIVARDDATGERLLAATPELSHACAERIKTMMANQSPDK